jgi:hypothetical protein
MSMRGTVLFWKTKERVGSIIGEDGNQYVFTDNEIWVKDTVAGLEKGADVLFTPEFPFAVTVVVQAPVHTCEGGYKVSSAGDACEESNCQDCCPHSDSRDHGICIDCGHEQDPGEAIDAAMDYYEGDR